MAGDAITLAARIIFAAWVAATILGVPFLSTSESYAARAIRRRLRRTVRR